MTRSLKPACVQAARLLLGLAVLFGIPALALAQKKTLAILEESKAELPNRFLHAVAISPDGKTIAAAEDNIHLFDISGGEPKASGVLKTEVFTGERALAFSPDGKKLAAGGADHILRIFDMTVNPPKEVHKLKEHTETITALAFTPDGATLASGSEDRTIFLWDMTGAKPTEKNVIKLEDKLKSGVKSVEFSPNGKMLSCGCENGTLRVWDVTGAQPKPVTVFQAKNANHMRVTYSNDGKMLALTVEKNISLYNGNEVGRLNAHTERVTGLAYAPDGKTLASVGLDGRIILWDLASGKIALVKERPGKFTGVVFAPLAPGANPADGMILAACTEGGVINVLKIGMKEP